jgi:hypothetical protein
VLAFTADVMLALQRFDDAHELVNADGRFWWHPLTVPKGTDDSRESHVMTLLRRVHDDLVRPKKKPNTTDG